MGDDAWRRNQESASGRRSRHWRDLLPALAGDARANPRRKRRGRARRARAYSRRLAACLRAHAAWHADRAAARGFSRLTRLGFSPRLPELHTATVNACPRDEAKTASTPANT